MKRSAHTEILGVSAKRASNVTVPTTTAMILSDLPFSSFAKRDVDTGARVVRDMNKRFSTVSLKAEPVRRARKRYSFTNSAR